MKRNIALLLFVLALVACLSPLSIAQSRGGGGGGGGSGGGGNARHGGNFPLTFDYADTINGRLCSGSGGYRISTYVTTLDVDCRCSNVDLPDGTVLYVYVHVTDWFTGVPWPEIPAGVMTLTGRKAQMQTLGMVVTGPGGIPQMRDLEIRTGDGTVVLRGHP